MSSTPLKKIFLLIELSGLSQGQITTDLIPNGTSWKKALKIPFTDILPVNKIDNFLF
jgi:hypothetical protein